MAGLIANPLNQTLAIVLMTTLATWGLNQIFPPNHRLLQDIKGRINSAEIRLKRIDPETNPKPSDNRLRILKKTTQSQ